MKIIRSALGKKKKVTTFKGASLTTDFPTEIMETRTVEWSL